MKKTIFSILLAFAVVTMSFGQKPRNIKKEPIPATMFQVTYAAQFPALDTKTDYGFTNTIGGSVIHKTESNWLFTANGNFIFGNQIKGSRIDVLRCSNAVFISKLR